MSHLQGAGLVISKVRGWQGDVSHIQGAGLVNSKGAGLAG